MSRRVVLGSGLFLVLAACAPRPIHAPSPCRTDIADCAAACTLRERGLALQADELDRRCAAAVLGVDLADAPASTSAAAPAASIGAGTAADAGAWRPFTITRKDPPGEPPECAAARILRDKHWVGESESMAALCVAKGGHI